ncbi:class I SAM-dependent DNA methyltransferase [Flavobacterium sp. XN-5]|uniref:DNA methyltransferase n=1 Tax=Flavobacterium sp. XN-5 TaxID=2599390 RepID=UPI0011C84DBB|nr:DNA methyltransferase [Flavobacterium sp. XN-5]NGY37245.1 class I SAM-dependent DNA methyltransferase [Flavobacterium sp. XN-5]
MNIAQIEENLQNLILNYTQETFIYELLLAYGLPKASITRLQKGNLNLSKVEGEISWKKKLFFKPVFNQDLHLAISEIKNTLKHDQRFVIVTDFEKLLAIDTKTADSLDIDFTTLPKHFDFFLPWAGMEKATHQNENPADVKAAEKMAKLFDEIKKDNPDNSPEFIHGLNVFLSRLLFCFFAEDTGIFELGQFTNALASHTQADGSDLTDYLDKLFAVLNTPRSNDARHALQCNTKAQYLQNFPYVNGGLFKEQQPTPLFNRRSRQAIIDAGQMDWAAINPDIFGSMFQAVISVDQRGSLGQHYTSVPNIMKVIEPLFLNDLYETFENAKGNLKKLNDLLKRIWNLKLFDPACGSGNFLIIAYKELRKLEMGIFKEIDTSNKTYTTQYSGISLNHFYGIELDDFAHEIAILSLWLAEHQMNQEFFKAFGRTKPALPLQQTGSIVHGNATRVDWEMVCPKLPNDEIYILGNPPYLGFSIQNKEQKEDIIEVFGEKIKLDYITCWFLKASNFISGINSKYAFVTTNSISQGEQVALLWPKIFSKKQEINFAYPAFKWENNAKGKAAVTCAIIGIQNINEQKKYLYIENRKVETKNINAYLTVGNNLIISRLSKPISKLPEMILGNSPFDGGNLILNNTEKEFLVSKNPAAHNFLKKLIGAAEFMQNDFRWCLWIDNITLNEARKIPEIENRISETKKMRLASTDLGTNKMASRAHQFRDRNSAKSHSVLVPRVGSSRRKYIPCGFINNDFIIGDSTQVVYDSETYIFSILSSLIHLTWVRAVAGYLKTDYRYSSVLCYNTFPFPKISQSQKEELEQCVFRILEERENHSEKTLAQMYDPDKMPEGLREAHRLNDLAVERCYRSKPFESDEERLEYLFKLYEKMIAEEKEKDTLFAKEKKARKQK